MTQKSNYLRIALFAVLAILCFTPWISAPVALVLGFFFTLFFGHPCAKLSSQVTKWLLKVAVVGLGFGMNVEQAAAAGKQGLVLTVFSITLVLVSGYFLGKLLGVNRRMAHLVSSGTAICGGSAIAAVSPVIGAKDEEISISLGVIFLLNSIALIIFPALGHYFNLTQHQFGLWSAIAIQDTSSVVGAASMYGSEALLVATTVKLTRALWIIPVSLLSMVLFKTKNTKVSIPWFIFLFVGAMFLNSYLDITPLATNIYAISKSLLVLTLFLIGSAISVSAIKKTGVKPIVLGVSLWFLISVSSLLVILYL